MALTNPEKVKILRERDGDYCMICGLLMNFNLPRGHPRAPSVDHIKPRAAGGTNRLDNLQLTHYKPCNSMKAAIYDGIDYKEQPVRTKTKKETTAGSIVELVWSTSSDDDVRRQTALQVAYKTIERWETRCLRCTHFNRSVPTRSGLLT